MSAASSSVAPDATASVTPDVTAIVVARGATTTMRRTLRSVLAQTILPAHLIVVDVRHEPPARELLADLNIPPNVTVTLTSAARSRNFGSAVKTALRELRTQIALTEWLWLLHEDSAPLPDALAQLLQAVEGNNTVAIAGPKQVVWGQPDRIIEVGYTTSRAGRRLSGVEVGEVDQGQHDGREDVLAVGLAGALVRREVWDELGGTDSVLGPFRDGLDLCVRARRAGRRVIAVPQALVEHVQLSLHGVDGPAGISDSTAERSFGPRLRSWMYVRAVMAPAIIWWLLPLWYVLCSIPRALWRIAGKQPQQAIEEIGAPWWLFGKLHRILLARHIAARTARIPRRALSPLFARTRDIFASDRDQRLARAAARQQLRRGNELEWATRRAFARRRRFVFAFVVFGLAVITVLSQGSHVRALWRSQTLAGGAMLPASGTWSTWWQAVSSGWNTQDLGAAAPIDPLITALAPAMVLTGGSLGLAVSVLFVLSTFIGGVGAWFASSTFTQSLPVRTWAALMWVVMPSYLMSIADGRFGSVLVHATLPWFVLALVHAVGLTQRRNPLVALGSAGLFFALIAAAAPVLFVPLFVVIAIAAWAARRHHAAPGFGWLVIPLPALALLAPLLVRVAVNITSGGWRFVIADPGGQRPWDAGSWWQLALGLVDSSQTDNYDSYGSTVLLIVPVVTVAVLAFAGLFRRGTFGWVARFGWIVAGIGAATAGLSARTIVSIADGQAVTGWPGAGLSLLTCGLMMAGLAAINQLATAARQYPLGWRQLAVTALAVLITVPTLGQLVVASRILPQWGVVTAAERHVVPAIASQMQQSDRNVRVLALAGTAHSVSYRLLRYDGISATQSSAVIAVDRLRADDSQISQIVGSLVGSSGTAVVDGLIDLGVGAVLLPDARDESADLADRLDTAAGLQRMTQGNRNVLWRVTLPQQADYQVSWARLDDEAGTAIPAQNLSINTTISAFELPRQLLIAERDAPGWQATLDGVALPKVERSNGLLAFDVGTDGGQLRVTYDRTSRVWWLYLQGGVFLVFTLLALPIRRQMAGAR